MAVLEMICSGIGGAAITWALTKVNNKMQIMKCLYIEDDILSKVPQKGENEIIQENLHCKKFKLINTTNKDIEEFKVFFQFDKTAIITDCNAKSKEGFNRQKIRRNKINLNEAESIIRKFNRKDWVEFTINVANVSENKYYVTESDCLGFKIKCRDKREKLLKAKSQQSDQVLVSQKR